MIHLIDTVIITFCHNSYVILHLFSSSWLSTRGMHEIIMMHNRDICSCSVPGCMTDEQGNIDEGIYCFVLPLTKVYLNASYKNMLTSFFSINYVPNSLSNDC